MVRPYLRFVLPAPSYCEQLSVMPVLNYRDYGRLWRVYGRSLLRYGTTRKLVNALRTNGRIDGAPASCVLLRTSCFGNRSTTATWIARCVIGKSFPTRAGAMPDD